MAKCETCGGSGKTRTERAGRRLKGGAQIIHTSDVHDCTACNGSGQQPEAQGIELLRAVDIIGGKYKGGWGIVTHIDGDRIIVEDDNGDGAYTVAAKHLRPRQQPEAPAPLNLCSACGNMPSLSEHCETCGRQPEAPAPDPYGTGDLVFFGQHKGRIKEPGSKPGTWNVMARGLLSRDVPESYLTPQVPPTKLTAPADLAARLNAAADEHSGAELGYILAEAAEQLQRQAAALNWALGCNGDFPSRQEGQGAYWWRTELISRAGLIYDGEKYVPTNPNRRES